MGEVTFYLDASVIVPLLLPDPHVGRAEMFRARARDPWVVSDFAAVEFAAVVARRLRTGELDREDAANALASFAAWRRRRARLERIGPADMTRAESYLYRLDLTLRAPDAIHIAVAQRLGATLATFDRRMADAARSLGVAIADG